MTKITTYNRGIIIDGHADTKEECETITLLCDSLAKDKNFKQVAYDDGYAAFERVGHTEELKFPPITYNLKGGEFHFCVFNSFYNSTNYGSPTANTFIYCGVFTTEFTQSFAFTSNGVSYDSIHLIADKNTPDNRKMYYVSGSNETLVYHNNTWTQEAYKILTYETQNVREGIYELITGTAAYGVSGGFVAPNGTYEVSVPLSAVSNGTAFVFSQFESNGATFNSIQWDTDTVKYLGPSVGDVYTPTIVYQGGWVETGYKIITIPAGTYMTYATIDIFAERLTASSKLSVDLTTLSGWANLSAGNHTIKIKAKGTGYKDSELSVGVTVSKAASTVTLEAGTYKWIDTPNIDIVLDRVDIAFTVSGTSYKAITINQGIKYTSRFTVTAFPTSSGGWADDVYKTITLDTAQTVSAEFYNWAITQGNLVKQVGYNLTINYSTVPMSTSAAYIKINSDTVSSSNYDYVVQPGTSSTNPTLKNSAGTTLSVPYVVSNVEKVAFMGGLAIAVGGSTQNASPYTLTADTTISPGVYGPTADTPIDEPTI